MPAGCLSALALSVALQWGTPAPSEAPNFPPLADAYGQYGFEGQFEQRYPFDTQQNWVHGYFQEIPAYGGHVFFRPYNYKDVLSQSQTAAGWGMSPTMPYSQQFWHRYHDQATMLKLSRAASPHGSPVVSSAGGWYAAPGLGGQPLPPLHHQQTVMPSPTWDGVPWPAGTASGSFVSPAYHPVQSGPVLPPR